MTCYSVGMKSLRAHGLVRHRDPALREQIVDVTKARREAEIEQIA